jgi:hypothetical protein
MPPEQTSEHTIHDSHHSQIHNRIVNAVNDVNDVNAVITTPPQHNTTRIRVFTAEEAFAYGG